MARPKDIPDLNPQDNLRTCLQAIALSRFEDTFSYEQAVLDSGDREALHDMRVAARRLRAILLIFRECFPKKKFKKNDEILKRLIRSLGAVRESDVFVEFMQDRRKNTTAPDGKIIDLLLAREESSRLSHRKGLVSELKNLHETEFTDSFHRFLNESLGKHDG